MKNYSFHTVGHFFTPTAFSPRKITEEFAFQKRMTQTNSNGTVKIELKDCFRDKSFPVTYRMR